MADALRDGRVDGILTNIPLDAEVIRPRPLVLLQATALRLILMRGVPRAGDNFTTAAHGLRVGRHHADSTKVVQDVLGGDGLGADARLGKGHVLGDVAREVVADHEHVEVLVKRVARVGPGRVRAAGEDVGVRDDGDDVGRVPAAGAFGVVGVDGALLEGRDGLLDEAGFVQRVGVDEALHVVFVAYAEAGVDGGGRAAPVFVELQPGGAGEALLAQGRFVAVVAFSRDAEVDWQLVTGLDHLPEMCLAGGTGCSVCAGAWTRTAAEHGRDAGADGFICLLGADTVDVSVETTGSDDTVFAGIDVRT